MNRNGSRRPHKNKHNVKQKHANKQPKLESRQPMPESGVRGTGHGKSVPSAAVLGGMQMLNARPTIETLRSHFRKWLEPAWFTNFLEPLLHVISAEGQEMYRTRVDKLKRALKRMDSQLLIE